MANLESRPQVVIAISGGGTTMKSVLEVRRNLPVDIVGVFSSNPRAGGLEKLKDPKLEFPPARVRVINPYDFKDADRKNDRRQYGNAINQFMKEVGADSVAQLGFIPMMPQEVVENARWVINQHPGPLDPGRIDWVTHEQLDFGGKGMRGSAVIAARVAYVWATDDNYWTEATVHLVTPDETHDRGKLLSTRRLDFGPLGDEEPLLKRLTFEQIRQHQDALIMVTGSVQKRLLPLEHQNVINALMQFEGGRIPDGFDRESPLIKPGNGNEYILFRAKDLAIEL